MNTPPALRIANAVVSALAVVLFLAHGVCNGFQLVGIASTTQRVISWALMLLVAVHAVIGIVLTIQTLRTCKAAGVSYMSLNKRFWASRITGLVLIVLITVHVFVFWGHTAAGGAYRLSYFGSLQLVLQILFVACIAVHVLGNIKPLLISLGIGGVRARSGDLVFALSLALLFMTIAFVVYFIRWSVV